MKRVFIFLLLCLACSVNALFGQDNDRQILAEQDLLGTARYTALSGAMAAVGGDVSAVRDNAAALGVFLHDEITVSLNWQTKGGDTRLGATNAAYLFNHQSKNLESKVVSNSFMIQYQRLNNFYRRYSLENSNVPTSQTDYMAQSISGITLGALQEHGWSNHAAWIGKFGYEGYLIDPVDTVSSNADYRSILENGETVNAMIEVKERGYLDEYTLGWGMNVNHKWYVGLSLNLRVLDYSKNTYYDEAFSNGKGYGLETSVDMHGVGFNANLGAILKPFDWWRLGLALQTPTWYNLKVDTYSRLYSDAVNPQITVTANDDYRRRKFTNPLRTIVGTAFQFKQYGMLSLEYDFQHFAHQYRLHTLKAGAELVFNRQWFVRAGYAICSPFNNNQQNYEPQDFSRTDTENVKLKYKQNISGGLGFRANSWLLEVAYQCTLMKADLYAYPTQQDAFLLKDTGHAMVLTFAWMFR